MGALPQPPLEVCERQIRESDALVVLVAHRYGWVPSPEQGGRDGKSVTWLEVEAALDAGRPVFAFVVQDEHPWTGDREQDRLLQLDGSSDPGEVVRAVQGLQRFKHWLRSEAGVVIDTFTTPEKLAAKVTSALASWAINTSTSAPGLRLPAIRARANHHLLRCLKTLGYKREWDIREVSAARALILEAPEEAPSSGPEPSSLSALPPVLLAGDSGQGKSWQLYRLGYELAQEEKLAVLIQGTGAIASDLEAVASIFCREIWESGSMRSLQDVRDMVRRELPELQDPWLTVLIDGVRDHEYALSLLQYPWQGLGLRLVLGCRWSDRFAQEAEPHTIQVSNFTVKDLSRYLKIRLGVDWIDFPEDMREYLKIPLLARLFCDLQSGFTTWKPFNEYNLFERAWVWQTARAPLAASAVAGLAARLPEERVYPWPTSMIWAAGLRDAEVRALVDSGLLRLASGGRSLEIWHDRILNWAVAEGLVSALRSGEITPETLASRAVQEQSDGPLGRRLDYIAMDTLWLLTTPEFGLDEAVSQFLIALESQWDRQQLLRNLPTLGARIVPHLVSRLATIPSSEEEE